MPMTESLIFSQLLARLNAVGGEIDGASISANGFFMMNVNHPDVNIVHGINSDTVEIRCRRNLFPPTHAHVDVDDIMTVIEGWMKEAGGKCGKVQAEYNPREPSGGPAVYGMPPKSPALKAREAEEDEIHEANERATMLKRKRQEWGVDRPPVNPPRPIGKRTYCVVMTRSLGDTEEHWLPTLRDAQWMVSEAKRDSRIVHIELQDHRPGGKEWYYDRDRSGFWKRTVHN